MNIKTKNKNAFKNCLEEHQERINHLLVKLLPSTHEPPQHLHEAMHYVVLNGGKRIRPLLVYLTGEALDVDLSLLDYPASAIEFIHAYSLVHDDLPAMDNDDLRRGKPTCHKAFDEATAILVGDALQSLAFNVLAHVNPELPPTVQLKMITCLAAASGSFGMAGGQALDLQATGQDISPSQLKVVHQLKTGSLISASVKMAALAAEIQEPAIMNSLVSFSQYVGLCFQIQDDILDLEGKTHRLGKTVGADAAKGKATFTTIQGLESAKSNLEVYYREAIRALSPLGEKANYLKYLAEYITTRDH